MIKKIIFIVLLLVGLVLGLFLVKQQQELRKGATGEVIDLYLAPSENADLSSKSVDDKLKVMVLGNTNGSSIGGISLRLRYDKEKLRLASGNDVAVNSAFSGFPMKILHNEEGYIDLVLMALDEELSGVIGINNPLASLDFEILALGNAQVKIDMDWAEMSAFGGEDLDSLYAIEVMTGESVDITYDIGGTGLPTNTPPAIVTDTPIPTNTATPVGVCDSDSDCGWCDGECKLESLGCDTTPNAPDGWECVCGTNSSCVGRMIAENTPEPTATGEPQATSTPIPEATPTLPENVKVVSFEVVLAGVREQNKCRGSNTVDVIMLKGTNRKEYRNVALVDTGRKTETGLAIFKVDKLDVTDFGETSDVAIFVKGQKHLQMKYGIDGQDAVYNRAGGELNFDNMTVFDFTKYPILAGDVNRDGKVDGIDFTEVKNRAGQFEEIERGQFNVHDLDSSCMINNMDIGLLVQALEEKYDQMY